MAVKTLPSETKLRSVEWSLIQPAQVNRSGYTGARQVMGLPGGARWVATVEFVPFNSDSDFRSFRAWIVSLQGQVHSFYLPVLDEQHAGSNPTSTVAAGATSATLSSAIGLAAGHFLTFTLTSGKKQMVMLTAAMSGTSVPSFLPALREAAPSGAVESKAPYAQMALSEEAVGWVSAPGRMFDLAGIDVEEAY